MIKEKMNEYFHEMAVGTFKELASDAFHWFTQFLPELCGYGALMTGAFVMVSSLFGRSILKPIGVYSGIYFTSICILEAV